MNINPYLNFNGNCEEAFGFYKSVFGGEYMALMRFGEMPGGEEVPGVEMDEAAKNKIMHIALPIGGGTTLFGSDTFPNMPAVNGSSVQIMVATDTKEDAVRIFEGLGVGGKVDMPMADTFWNAHFGALTDRFGIIWMVHFQYS